MDDQKNKQTSQLSDDAVFGAGSASLGNALTLAERVGMVLLGLGLITALAVGGYAISQRSNRQTTQQESEKNVSSIALEDLMSVSNGEVQLDKPLRVSDNFILSPTPQPTGAVSGQLYYDQSTNRPYYFNGTSFISLSQDGVTSLGGASGSITLGNGLSIVNNQLSVTAIPAQVGTVLQSSSNNPIYSAGTGIAINGQTISNGGVTSLAGTANQILVSQSSGGVTLSLPQDIAVSSSPSFASIRANSLKSQLSGSNETIISFANPTTTNSVVVPDAGGTICLSSNNCGFAAGGSYVNLQVATPGVQQIGNIHISGSILAGSFSGDGTNLANVNAAQLGGQSGSYYTNASNVSSGTLSDARLSTNVTTQGNTFNGTNQLVQTNGFGALPSLSGTNLTNLNGSSIASGTVADARLTTNVTLQGNSFNGSSQLVQTTAGGLLPALSGINLTNVDAAQLGGQTSGYYTNASNIASGTLADARLSNNVALQNAANIFTGANVFQNTVDSTTAFRIQNAAGTNLFVADTTNSRVGIGLSGNAALSTLHTSGTLTVGYNGGTAGAPGVLQLTQGGSSPTSNRLNFGTDGTGWGFAISKNQAGTVTDILYVKDNGNVGIGNLSPTYKLDVAGSTTTARLGKVILADDAPFYTGANINAGANQLGIGTTGAGILGLFTNNAERLRVDTSGNVGIGTTAPSAKLEVRDNTSQTVFASATKGVVHIQGGGLNNDYTSLTFGDTNLSPTGKIAVLKTASGSYLQFGTTNLWGGITNTALSIDYNGGSTFRNGVNSTTGFQIQNAAASPLFVVDTTNSRIGVGGAPVNGPGDAFQVVGGIRTSAASIRIPNGSVLAIQQDSGARGGISSLGINIGLSSTASTYGTIESSNTYGIGLNINGVTAGSIAGANGAALFRNTANSTTGFQIQNAAGTAALFNADTTNMTITVGSGTVMPTSIFATKVDSTTGAGPWGTIAGDFNGDGKTDAIVTNYSAASASVYINTGTALPATATSTLTTGTGPTSVATGDFNGDGRIDAVVNNYTSGNASVYINTGSALPTTATYTLATGSLPIFSTVGDFNGDGKTDLVITNNTSSNASVYINTGSALPTTATSTLTTGSSPMGISSGDFNGDGKTDVILANSVTNNVMVYTNTGSGLPTTASSTHTGVTTPHGIAVGDFNGDGKTDAIIANNGAATATVFINTGVALPATASSTLTTASVAYSVYTGDFNGDGKTDAVTANYGGGGAGTTSSVFINSGTALPVTATSNLTTGLGPVIVSGGDFNGDGKADLISTNTSAATASVFINTYNSLSVNGQTTVGRLTANGALQVSGTSLFQDAVTARNSVNSTRAFSIQNTAGQSLFSVDTLNNNITIGGNNSGELQVWQTGANALPAVRGNHYAGTANGYAYIIGGTDGTNHYSTVYYAKLNADGSTGTWSTNANALPAVRGRGRAVAANGYIYVIGGWDGTNTQSTVYYAKLNSDGSTGAWATNPNALPDVRSNFESVVANGYVYVVGGNNNAGTPQSTVYYARLNPDGTTGTWSTNANSLAQIRSNSSAVIANGFIYILAGYNGTGYTSTVYYARLNIDGSTGTWSTNANAIPAVRGNHAAIVANGYVYVIGGTAGSNIYQSTVYYSKLNTDGTTGVWATGANSLPAVRGVAPLLSANGYIYEIGGYDGSGSPWMSTVYYASTQRLRVGGALDLVGLGGATLADNETGTGGELTAGNTNIVGMLQVSGSANIAQSAAIGGDLNVSGAFNVATGRFTANVADGASATAFTFNNTITLATSGAKLFVVQNNGTTKFAIDKDGRIITGLTPSARAYNSSNITLTTNTPAALALNSERWDNEVIHDNSTNNSRLTAKTAGFYTIQGNACFAASATSSRNLRIRLNGTTNIGLAYHGNAGATDQTCLVVSTTYQLSVNDYVELVAEQNSGGNLDITAAGSYSPELSIVRVGP